MNGEGQSLWPAGLDGVRPATAATGEAGAGLWGGVGTCGHRSETVPAAMAGAAETSAGRLMTAGKQADEPGGLTERPVSSDADAGDTAGDGEEWTGAEAVLNQAGDAGELVPAGGSGGGEADQDADFGPGGPGQDEQSGWRNDMGLMDALKARLRERRVSTLALWKEYRHIIQAEQPSAKQVDRLVALMRSLGLTEAHVELHRAAMVQLADRLAVVSEGERSADRALALQQQLDDGAAQIAKIREAHQGLGEEVERLTMRKLAGHQAAIEADRLRAAFPAIFRDDAEAEPVEELNGAVSEIASNRGLWGELQGRGYQVE